MMIKTSYSIPTNYAGYFVSEGFVVLCSVAVDYLFDDVTYMCTGTLFQPLSLLLLWLKGGRLRNRKYIPCLFAFLSSMIVAS